MEAKRSTTTKRARRAVNFIFFSGRVTGLTTTRRGRSVGLDSPRPPAVVNLFFRLLCFVLGTLYLFLVLCTLFLVLVLTKYKTPRTKPNLSIDSEADIHDRGDVFLE